VAQIVGPEFKPQYQKERQRRREGRREGGREGRETWSSFKERKRRKK
jgi:hypothetical protein